VILATYQQPEWLRKVLWGYGTQTARDFEILVADDGSEPDTAAVVDEAARDLAVPVRYVRHDDRGYRKCVILNRAVLEARSDYLIFSDGDCVPRRDFVATHLRLRRPGRFLSGGALRLPMALSRALTRDDIESGRIADVSWLAASGWSPGHRRLRLVRPGAVAAMLDRITPTGATWNGNNASVTRETVLRLNGFEAALGSGGQDREFGQRLENAGVRGVQVRHRAVLLHLDHRRPYRTEESIATNRTARDEVARTGRIRATAGIAELDDLAP
jgi:glycosyltransferase involved in cell wall biosynthesis